MMPDDVKKAMIDAYLERCKLKFQLTFAEWRLHTKYSGPNQEIIKEVRKI